MAVLTLASLWYLCRSAVRPRGRIRVDWMRPPKSSLHRINYSTTKWKRKSTNCAKEMCTRFLIYLSS